MNLSQQKCATWCIVVFLAVALHAGTVEAASPLAAKMEQVGPRTEAVDLGNYQKVLYVSADADILRNLSKDGFDSVGAALKSAKDASAENRYAVLVAGGNYREANLQMLPFVDLFGGYDKTWARDIKANRAVLDAGGKGRVLLGADDATLDGFVITGGKNNHHGGAILCDRTSPTISNNILTGNATTEPEGFVRELYLQEGSAGGAVALTSGSHAVVRNNIIADNTTNIGPGGGIYVWNNSNPTIVNNVLSGNHTGLTDDYPHPGKTPGSRSSSGGGIAVSHKCYGEIEISNNVVVGNWVGGNSDAGGLYMEYDASPLIQGNWIVGNRSADDGGGMYIMKDSEPRIEGNIFSGNRSAGIRLSKEGRMRASDNYFFDNIGGGIMCRDSWMVLTNNTMVPTQQAAVSLMNDKEHFRPSRITKNIMVNQNGKNPVGVDETMSGKPDVMGNLFRGFVMEGNLDADPQFIDDSLEGKIADKSYLADAFVTQLQVGGAGLGDRDLAGRVIRIGKQWSVVQSNTASEIVVWGNLADDAPVFTILGTYQLAKDSPAKGFGAKPL